MKVILVVGARPNFMKIAPILKTIDKHNASGKSNSIEPSLIHTGQHYDYEMSKVFFDDLALPQPNVHLGVGSGTHAEQTGKTMIEVEKVLARERPDLVIVVGDVNATLAGALAAVKLHMPVAHVEAGLRSYDQSMPEEINRVLTDHCSQLLFCPTETAVGNLKKEGIIKGVYLTGDVMVDALLSNKQAAEKSEILKRLDLESGHYLVITIHRPSNTDERENLENIVSALSDSAERVIFPVHPRTRKALDEHGVAMRRGNIMVIDPLGYTEFLKLMTHAKKILTDSGGIQKEAYILGIPCITLRERTEWVETVEDGWNILVSADKKKLIEAIQHFEPARERRDIFGNGTASTSICQIILQGSLGKGA